MTYIEMGIYFGGFLASLGFIFSAIAIHMYCEEQKKKEKHTKKKEIESFLEIP